MLRRQYNKMIERNGVRWEFIFNRVVRKVLFEKITFELRPE